MKTGARLVLGKDDEGRRLDRVLRIALGEMPLSAIHKALRKGDIRVGGARRDPESRCAAGEVVEISGVLLSPGVDLAGEPSEKPQDESRPANPNASRRSTTPSPSFPILLETPDLVFVDKPIGVLVHDGSDSLEALVRQYVAPTLSPSLSFAPGPLHRLDRNTSGVIAFSKRHRRRSSLFRGRSAKGASRKHTWPCSRDASRKAPHGKISSPATAGAAAASFRRRPTTFRPLPAPVPAQSLRAAGAKEALTKVTPLAFSDGLTLAEIALGTGRTHQIRAQAGGARPSPRRRPQVRRQALRTALLPPRVASFDVGNPHRRTPAFRGSSDSVLFYRKSPQPLS